MKRLVAAMCCLAIASCGGGNGGAGTPGEPIRRIQFSSATAGAYGDGLTTHWADATHDGNLLLLMVSVDWISTVGQIAVPQEWTLVERADMADGFRQISTALYFQDNARAQSGTVTVGAVQSAEIHVLLSEYAGVAKSGSLDRSAQLVGSSSRAMTGTTPPTSQASELWIGAISNVSGFTQCSPTDGFTQVGVASSGASTIGFYESIVNSIGSAGLSADIIADFHCDGGSSEPLSLEWAGVVATFRD